MTEPPEWLVEAIALTALRERFGSDCRREEITEFDTRTARAVLVALAKHGKLMGREPTKCVADGATDDEYQVLLDNWDAAPQWPEKEPQR